MRTTSEQFAYYRNGEPIFPSYWTVYRCASIACHKIDNKWNESILREPSSISIPYHSGPELEARCTPKNVKRALTLIVQIGLQSRDFGSHNIRISKNVIDSQQTADSPFTRTDVIAATVISLFLVVRRRMKRSISTIEQSGIRRNSAE